MLDDPRLIQLRRAFEGRVAAAAERAPGMKEAAVALVLRPQAELELLVIRRAELQGDPWSGHVALPGGRRSRVDGDLVVTACRETSEEVGVPLARVGNLIGALDEVAPLTPRLPPIIIAPFVYAVPSGTTVQPDAREVQAALWIPLSALRDTAALSEISVTASGATWTVPSLVYGDYVIWGLTYRVLQQFLEVAGSA
ncbi:MAG TPA: CoA pyrophosphatase [Longimicrobiales bacterium]|nr:CoA pyrophosphatase [Longimicrobiales bacterium]